MAALRETIQNSSNPTDTSISSSTSHIDFSNLFLLFYHILKFTFLIYYFVSLSLRLSFMNFTFTSPYLGSILVDYLIDLFFIIDYISFEYHHSISNTIVVPIDSVAESAEIVSIDFMRSARRNSASSLGEFYVAKSSFFHPQRFLYEIICTLPMEIVGYLIHYPHFPWLRLNRLLRIYSAIEYWSHIIQAFERCGVQIKSSVSRILLGCLFHTIICHFAGCAYYILAIFTMKDGHGKTWLSHDNSVVLDDESNELVFIRPKYQIYIRAIYWSAQTLETIGLGDICAHNARESIFAIFYCYIAMLTAQITISNVILMITSQDESRNKYIDRTTKLTKYGQFRSLSKKLLDQCHAYYKYQHSILQGVDEHQFIKELPASLQYRIMKTMIREMLAKVDCLQSVPPYFLSTLTTEVQTELYFPSEVIVNAGSPATGLYIVSRGIVVKISPEIAIGRKSINNSKLKLLQSLKEGDWFGERSLYIEGEIYLLSYQSRSFCEILYLSSLRFKRQCQLHLTKLERESLEKFLHERQHHHSIEHENRPHSESSEENENPAEGGHKNAEENDENNHGNTVEKSHIIQSSGIELNSLEKKQDIGKKIQFPLQPQVSDIDNSDSDSTFDGPSHTSGSVIVSRKQRRVALQLGASIKFEETNYITVWFHPESKFMIFWRLLVAFAVLYYMFAAPLLLSASFDHNILRQHTTLFVFCYLTDLVMMTNLIMSMFFFPFLKDGIIISKAEAIFEYYRSSHYVFLDVFALLPYDLLAIYFGANFIPILRLPRLYLVLQTTRYLNELKGFSEASEKGQFLVLVWWLYMLIHWFGCLFILSARMSTRMFGYETNWIEVDQQSDVWSFDHTDFNNLALYFRSIYWALYVTSSAGYYDILPTNPFETVVATFIMLYGCQMVVGLLGGVSSVVETLTSDPISFQTKLENTQALAARKGLSVGIREKLACYFQYNWERCRGVEESQVLANLPLPLRQGVIKEITGAVLRKIVFFQDCSDGILNAILASLQPRIFIDGDSVVTAGEYGTDFFVIESGCIVVTSADRTKVFVTLGAGNYLGESCLMGLQVTRRVASAHSQGYSYTYALRNIDFATAISPYPEEGKAIIRKIKQVLDLKASKNATNNRPIATNDPSPTPTPATTTPAPSTPTSSFSMDSPPIVSSLPINSKSFYHPDSLPRQLWGLLLLLIFLYNMFMIPLRFSLSITPYLYILDYLLDGILLINLYLIYCKFYTLHRGVYVTDTHGLRDLFLKENFSYGYFACIPFDILGIFMINQPPSYLDYTLKICRITKLFIVFDASLYAKYTLSLLEKLRIPYFATIILRMFITVCLIGHWSACGFYLIPSYVNRDSDHEDQYTGTWIEFQINSNKLPLDGGNQWTRYIRSLNWSIPTLTLVVIADIFPVNNEEMMYGLLVMFFGFMLNGAVVGTMITLLTRDSSESTDVHIVRNLLETRNVDLNLRIRVVQHLNFLSSTAGQLLLEEESMIKELPFSLQLAIVENTKLPLLNKCPLFDTCSEESKRNLCLAFRQQIYCDGDLIIKCGDIGQEMYFLIEGSVDICNDSGVSFTTLQAGSFFGETGLVFSDRRMSNVKAIGTCVCYCLDRVHLDNELKASSEEEAQLAFQSLQQLLASNQKRNAAISKNLAAAKDPSSKLSKLIVSSQEITTSPFLQALRNPNSKFCISWDIFGFIALLYYAVSIPYHVAYLLHDDLIGYRPYLVFDFLVDVYWILDIYFRLYYFTSPRQTTNKYETDVLRNLNHYRNTHRFKFDCITSFPLEVFALVPGTSPILVHFLRLLHLGKVFNIYNQINMLHLHLDYIDVRINSAVVMLFKSCTIYVLIAHWIACGYFMIHRYFLRHDSITWAIADGLATFDRESGTHNVCDQPISYCYLRSIYFVTVSLTTIGYGDMAPYHNIEMCYQIFVVALSGICLNALVCGSFGQYWASIDSSSMLFFKKKMKVIEQFVQHRKLDDSLRDALVGQFEYVWMLERQTGGYETNFLTRLSPSLAAEVALVLRGDIVKLVPIFSLLHSGRIALALRPLILFKGSTVFSRGDIGEDIYFIRKGCIRIIMNQSTKYDNTRAMYLQRNKMASTRGLLYKGSHFGEMCTISPVSLCVSTAVADVNSEVFFLSKDELWKILLFISRTEQRIFLIKLFIENNNIKHSPFNNERLESVKLIGRTITTTIDNLYELSDSIMNEIIDEGIRNGNIQENIKNNEDVFFRLLSKDPSYQAMSMKENLCPWYEVLRAYEQKKVDTILAASSRSINATMDHQPPYLEIKRKRLPLDRRSISIINDDLRLRVKSLFQFMDLDGSGSVSRHELMSSLQSLGWRNVTWDDVDQLLADTVRSDSDRLHLEDLVEVICNELQEQHDQLQQQQQQEEVDQEEFQGDVNE